MHYPWSRLRRTLSGILPCEARTFLTWPLSVLPAAITCSASPCYCIICGAGCPVFCECATGERADERGQGPVAWAVGGRLWRSGKSKRPGGVPDGDRRNSTGMPDAFPSQCASDSVRVVRSLPRPERLRAVKIFSLPHRCPPTAHATGPCPLSVSWTVAIVVMMPGSEAGVCGWALILMSWYLCFQFREHLSIERYPLSDGKWRQYSMAVVRPPTHRNPPPLCESCGRRDRLWPSGRVFGRLRDARRERQCASVGAGETLSAQQALWPGQTKCYLH